jgi:hypothetical protein
MQPNNQQGYYNPDPNQPVQPQIPQAPVVGQQPQPVQPVDSASMQAVLDEQGPAPQPQQFAAQQQTTDEQYDDEEEYEDEADFAPVSWTAHEYIHQDKGTLWYVVFFLLVIVGVGVTVWLQQWTFTAVLIVIAVVVVVNGKRPPRDLNYLLDADGLTIDGKLHKFENYKSFGVIQDREHFSVMLIPIQRFQPSVSVYFPEESGEAIVDMLGARLPMKDLKLDAVDHMVRWLKL